MGIFAPLDASFLWGESREHPMHVGGLYLFELPKGAGPDYVSELYAELLRFDNPRPLLRRRPADPVSSVGNLRWTEDENVDLEHHVRLLALPRPGRVRQLLELTSRMHGTLLDRHRPLWEMNLIEGLEGNRFAMYAKMHHALADGITASRLTLASFSEDPEAIGQPMWVVNPNPQHTWSPDRSGPLGALLAAPGAIRDVAGLGPVLARMAGNALRRRSGDLPFPAPRTMLNVPITGARRFAAQSWPLERLKKAGASSGATLNDLVLAMCAGALRRYLLAAGALPDQPLVAAVPVSLRVPGRSGAAGNEVAMVLCNLATSTEDPQRRLDTIVLSMRRAKEAMAGQSRLQLQLLTTLINLPAALAVLPGYVNTASPLYNLVISNVPGPRKPLYWNGARLQGSYPVSIPYEGQALNITVTSYAGAMQFGLTGCRRSVPHLQHMLGYLEDSLAELEI